MRLSLLLRKELDGREVCAYIFAAAASGSVSGINSEAGLPAWIDDVLRKALHPDSSKRPEAVSEFVYDLHHPKPARARPPLAQRHPVMFWKGVSTVLALLLFALAMLHFGMP